ncbi:MAG: MFS transporter [Xanthobacteraceae bacterium]|nr:MFS transporter [Xanthobacteraceae bacterium]
MDQLTERQRTVANHIPFRDVYRGPLAIAFAASIASVSGATLLYPVLPVLAADLKVDEAQIGLVMAAFTAPAIVLAPLFGIMADLYGRRWLLVFGLAVFGVAGAAAAFAPTYEWVLILRAIQGIGASTLLPLTIVLISDILPDDRELRGQGIKVALDRVSMIVLPLVGGALAILSWRVAFLPFLLIVALAVAAYLWMPETNKGEHDSLRDYLARTSRAIREPRLTLAFATGFLRFFLDFGLYTYLPIIAALRYGASPAAIGILIALSAVGSIITALGIGRIYGRVATETLLALAFFASAIGVALPAVGAPLWLIAIGLFLFGLGNGLISPLQKSLMTRRTPPELRGGVIAVDRVIQQVAKSAAPALLGALLLVAPLEALFWVMAAMSALGTVALIVVALMRDPVNSSW